GHDYFGAVTLAQALALSLNTVSVRLTLECGPAAVVKTAHRMGIASKLEANPSIALGTSEVSVLELVSAYAPFANGGSDEGPHRRRQEDTLCQCRQHDRPRGRCALRRNDEHDDARDAHHRHRAQSRPAGLDGGRQDRHQSGFP